MEMFNAIKTLHEHKLVHRDVKPDNFRVKNGQVYIIDFGTYIKLDRLKDTKLTNFIGTPNFASINVLQQNYYTLYDDLESLGYSLICLIQPDATCFIQKLEGHSDYHYHKQMIETKETFLRSSWDPSVSHVVEFINAVRTQRQQDPDGTPDYEVLRQYLNELERPIEQPDQIEQVAEIDQEEVPQLDED